MKTSNYTSNEFNVKLREAIEDEETYNEMIDAVDSEIEAQLTSQCQECDLHRKYRM